MTPKKQLATLKSLRHAVDCAQAAYADYSFNPASPAGHKAHQRYVKWCDRADALYSDLKASLEAAASVDQRTLKRK